MNTVDHPPTSTARAQSEGAPLTQRYAGFWRRTAAALVDAAIILAPLVLGIYLLFPAQIITLAQEPPPPSGEYWAFLVVYVLAVIGYMAGLESSPRQATLGKQLLGIRVTDLEGQRVSFFRAVRRGWFYWLPMALILIDTAAQFMVFALVAMIVALVSCFAVAFTERNQALHDITSGCLLLHRNAEAS